MRPLVLAGSVLFALPAFACMNGMKLEDKKRQQIDLLVQKAAQKIDDKDFKGAVKDAEEALAANGAKTVTKRQARRVLGLAQLRLGRLEDARATFERCREEAGDPNEPQLLARLGEADVGLGRFAEARARLEDLATKDLLPDADAKVALAKARLAAGDSDGAKAAVKSALEQEPKHAGALALKAQLEKPQPAAAAKKTATRS